MDRSNFLYKTFLEHFSVEPTPCQDRLFHTVADFATGDDADILVVNGYAGTGKTTAIAAVINGFRELKTRSILLAPTGRSAKVFSGISGLPAYTIHKHIYRQKSVGADGFGQFSLAPNKAKGALFVVDEVSLIGIDSAERQSSSLFGTGNLLEDLVTFVRSGVDCRLILIGDSAQLPPVGMDQSPALSPDFMDSFGGVMYAEMTSVVRQAQDSGILRNATALREIISGADPYDTVPGLKIETSDDVCRVSGSELIETLADAYGKYGEDDTIVLSRSNKRAIRYNLGIRSTVQFKEDRLVRGDKLMIVRNCYQFVGDAENLDYIANGDIAKLLKISNFEDRYGLHFADARLCFEDYDDQEIDAKVCLDTLESEAASLTYEQQNALYQGVNADYDYIAGRKKRYEMVREDKYYNALQLKYAQAITCHKSQGGQWRCVFIDCPFWQQEQTLDDIKWLYTAFTRASEKIYLVNFNDRFFK